MVPQPKAAEIYYSTCAAVDRHNRCRQADLNLEKTLRTHDLAMRVGMSLLGVVIVDAWLAYSGCIGERLSITQKDFYSALSEELIDNSYDQITARRKRQSDAMESAALADNVPHSGIGPHLTPTKRRTPGQMRLLRWFLRGYGPLGLGFDGSTDRPGMQTGLCRGRKSSTPRRKQRSADSRPPCSRQIRVRPAESSCWWTTRP